MDGTPARSISACHPSGRIQTVIFTKWFDHFVHFVKPLIDYPVLLVVDDHYSHIRNLDALGKAREQNVLSVSHHILHIKCNHLTLVSWAHSKRIMHNRLKHG